MLFFFGGPKTILAQSYLHTTVSKNPFCLFLVLAEFTVYWIRIDMMVGVSFKCVCASLKGVRKFTREKRKPVKTDRTRNKYLL